MEAKKIAEIKSEHIKEVLYSNLTIEEKRRQEYFENQAKAKERIDKLEELAREEKRMEKAKMDKENERKKEVKVMNDKMREEKRQFYWTKLEETEDKVIKSQMRKTMELKEKHNIDVLKRTDRRENVERIMKMQEYQREKIMEKIMNDNAKAENLKEERANILGTRYKLRQEIEKNKQEIMEKFNKIKLGKVMIFFLLNS